LFREAAAEKKKHFLFAQRYAASPPPRGSLESTIHEGLRCLDDAKRGVSQGYAVSLELVGLGYTAEVSDCRPTPQKKAKARPPLEQLVAEEGTKKEERSERSQDRGRYVVLNLGKSHKIFHYLDGKSVDVVSAKGKDNSTTILIFGLSKSITEQTAAEIGAHKKPGVYDAKGVVR